MAHGIEYDVERTFFVYPEVDGLLRTVAIPGLTGRESQLSHPIPNMVGMAHLDDAGVDSAITAVKSLFGPRRAFGWVTSPNNSPANLGARLEAAGMHKDDEMAGMVLDDLATPIRTNDEVTIRPATDEELAASAPLAAQAYGLPLDVAQWWMDITVRGASRLRQRMYFAYVKGREEPAALANLVLVPDSDLVLLGGAATLPDVRGQGIYTSLVARRLADARELGAQRAVIQAVRNTSAPVCAKLGFREVVPFDGYAWIPEESAPAVTA